jgi:RNA polymerase sigma-70 factor (ECF subfamily)
MEDLSRDIIEQAAEGDRGAFEAIYKATSGFVYSTALRIVNNSADAQEITQDIFMKIYDNLKNFEFRSSFKTWVYRITVNAAINAYYKNKREYGRRQDFDTVLETAGTPPEAFRAVEQSDNERALTKLLGALTPEHRAIITLRELEHLSYEDIANTLKINLNTVRSRLKRARQALLEHNKRAVSHAV